MAAIGLWKFNADLAEQRDLFRRLRPIRLELEEGAGGPVIVVFHTRSESARLYAEFVERALRSQLAADVASADSELVMDLRPIAKDVRVDPGTTALPRRAA